MADDDWMNSAEEVPDSKFKDEDASEDKQEIKVI